MGPPWRSAAEDDRARVQPTGRAEEAAGDASGEGKACGEHEEASGDEEPESRLAAAAAAAATAAAAELAALGQDPRRERLARRQTVGGAGSTTPSPSGFTHVVSLVHSLQ